MRESEVIARFFRFASGARTIIGAGEDDAAVLSPPPRTRLVCSSDSLIEDVHFFADADSYFLARKSAAVSLSDIAAMGARPLWMTVALAANDKKTKWFARFAEGLKSSTAEFGYAIVGGDLCRAAKVHITTTVIGALKHPPLLRSGARAGEDVWISGAPGEAALAVHCRKNGADKIPPKHLRAANERLHNPSPRLSLGYKLAKIASAAIDMSDGLAACANAIAARSGVKIILHLRDIPPPPCLENLPPDLRQNLMLCGGDDYELFFCAPQNARRKLSHTNAIRIGETAVGGGVKIVGENGATFAARGYEHDFGG